MKEFNYLSTIYKSFYSKALYRDVARNWGAGVCLYLFLLLAICWGVMIARIQPTFSQVVRQVVQLYASQAPEISIKDGIVSTPENHPYFINDPNSKKPILIIDTSGQYTKLEPGANAAMLLTKNQFWTLGNQNVVKIYELPKTLTLDIKPKVVQEKITSWAPWAWVILFPVSLLVSFLYRLVEALIYAVIGKIASLITKVTIPYADIFKITVVALTPTIILGTILDFIGVAIPKEPWIYFILAIGYIIFGILANRTADKR